MTNMQDASPGPRAARRTSARLGAVAAGLVLALAACDVEQLLEVEDPDVATPEALTGAASLPALFAGALSDFQVGYSGSSNGDGQITVSALLSDELYNSESFPTRIEIDQRRMRDDNGTLRGVFLNLQRARAAAERAVARYEEFDAGTVEHAHMLNIAGLSYVTFGENYCSGVPFSRIGDDGRIVYGTQQTTAEMFQTAADRFSAALDILDALSGGSAAQQRYLAQVGLGRALLNLGQFAQAAAAVQGVPDDFVYLIEHSENSGRQQNPVYTLVNVSRRFSVPDVEGDNGLPFRTADDPRVPVVRHPLNPIGLDNETPSWIPLKYEDRSADVPVATGIEARLIEAEAALQANDYPTTLDILNTLRADFGDPSLGALTPAATRPAQEDQLFSERAFWLYLTSHRVGDLRRLVRQYTRGIESVFPTGDYHKSGSLPYGPDVNLPLPDDEKNNPEVTAPQCLDRNP